MTLDQAAEWELPSDWLWVCLADIADIAYGQSPPSDSYNQAGLGLPFFQGKTEFKELHPEVSKFCEHPTRTAKPGDILLSIRAPVGPTNVADRDCGIGRGLAAIRARKDISGTYLRYFIRRTESVLAQKGTGTTFSAVTKPVVDGHRIALAPARQQRAIASKIDELFSRIDAGEAALKRAKALVERYRKSILKAAIIGQLTKDWRGTQSQRAHPAKSSNGIAYECLGELPTSWAKIRIDEAGKVQLGRQRSPKHHLGEHMRPYLRVANVFEARFNLSDVMRMNFTPKEYETYRLEDGDILLNEGQSKELVGRPALYRNELPGGCFTNTLIRFRSNPLVLPEFALLVFRHYMHDGQFAKIARITTNIAHLGAERFAAMSFPLPTVSEQRVIVETVERLWSQIDVATGNVMQIRRASDGLRQSVLRAAFEGSLVPQKAEDEPASVLLERICRAAPSVRPKKTKRGK